MDSQRPLGRIAKVTQQGALAGHIVNPEERAAEARAGLLVYDKDRTNRDTRGVTPEGVPGPDRQSH